MTDQTIAATNVKQKTAKSRATRKGKAKLSTAQASASKPSSRKGPSNPTPATKKPTKRDQLAAMLLRDEGATIDDMTAATGWLPHTVRAAITGLKKLGYAIDSDKIDELRTYRAVEPK